MPRIPQQLRLAFQQSSAKTAGGSQLRSNPKTARPFSANAPLHIVLRAQKDMPSLHRRARTIQDLTHKLAKQQGIRVYAYANVGNHIHLMLLAPTRHALRAYLRGLGGTLARIALNAAKSRPKLGAGKQYWLGRPFSRIVSWGRDFKAVKEYIAINVIEGAARVSKKVARELFARIQALQRELAEGKIASLQVFGLELPG